MTFTVEYIWLDSDGGFRSKTRVLSDPKEDISILEYLPKWNYDGSSTNQAEGHRSEVTLVPKAVFLDPFRKSLNGYLAICETYDMEGNALPNNHRKEAEEIFNQALALYVACHYSCVWIFILLFSC